MTPSTPSTMKLWAPVAGGSAKGSGTPKMPRAMTTAITQSMRMPTRRTPNEAIEPGPLCGRPRRWPRHCPSGMRAPGPSSHDPKSLRSTTTPA